MSEIKKTFRIDRDAQYNLDVLKIHYKASTENATLSRVLEEHIKLLKRVEMLHGERMRAEVEANQWHKKIVNLKVALADIMEVE